MKWNVISKWRLPSVAIAKKAIIAKSVTEIHWLATKKAPYDTGLLRKSLAMHITSTYGKVGSNQKYAKIQEFGWVIRPKKKKLLAWKAKGGGWAFARQVRIKAQPYLIPAFESVTKKLWNIIITEINKTTK